MDTWIRDLYDAVDSMNYEEAMSYYAHDVRFQIGNRPAATGKDALVRGLDTILGVTKRTRHQFLAVAETDEADGKITMLELNVTYTRWDDQVVTIPSVTILRHKNEKIQDFRLYIDAAPLIAGPPAKFHSTGVARINTPGGEFV